MDWLPLKCMGLEYRVARNGVMGFHRYGEKKGSVVVTKLISQGYISAYLAFHHTGKDYCICTAYASTC